MKSEPTLTDPGPLPPVCPGCGGDWSEAAENTSGSAACLRCGVDRQEALWLLWNDVAAPYAAAYEAAREGRFREARALLDPLLQSTVCSETIRRLDCLCASVLGENPPGGAAPDADLAQARLEYADARRAAGVGNVADALTAVDRCLSHTPQLLPAQKLRMLLLAGARRGTEAEAIRTAVTVLFPNEPDITRWKFSVPPAPRRVSRRKRMVPVILQNTAPERAKDRWENKRGVYALPAALIAVALSLVSLTMSWKPLYTKQQPPVSVGTAAPVKKRNTLPEKKRVLAADLVRERGERHGAADFALARTWFNRAVRAKNRSDWQECDRLAAAAYQMGENSYLADESLVLRALAADNRGVSRAIRCQRYASIAEDTPNSVYVSWALRTAIRLSEQDGQTEQAEKFRRLLRLRQTRPGAGREDASSSET